MTKYSCNCDPLQQHPTSLYIFRDGEFKFANKCDIENHPKVDQIVEEAMNKGYNDAIRDRLDRDSNGESCFYD